MADENVPAYAKTLITQLQAALEIFKSMVEDAKPSIPEFLAEERRQHSLVVANVPESTADEPQQRAREDQQFINNVLNVCELDVTTPSAIFRMGKPTNGRNRLIKLEFPTKAAVWQVLRNSSKLKQNNNYKRIQIRPSMSKQQLEERSKLIQQCTDRRNESKLDFVIYNGMVVQRKDIPKRKNY